MMPILLRTAPRCLYKCDVTCIDSTHANRMMEKLLICLLLLLPLSGSLGEDTAPRRLQFAFLTSLTGRRTTAETVPAVEFALRNINEDPTLLPGYELEYGTILDSGCDRTTSLDAFFEEVPLDPTDIAVIGCGCSDATEAVAEIVHYWNIPLISYASSSSLLSDGNRFKNYFQMHPIDENLVLAFASVIEHYGWTRVSVITEKEPRLQEIERSITAELITRDISMIASLQFEGRLNVTNLENLSRSDVRIVFLNAYPRSSRDVMCKALRKGLVSPRYVWITYGWSDKDENGAVEPRHHASDRAEWCTDEEIVQFLRGTIAIQLYPAPEDVSTPTTSGIEIENLEPHKYTPIVALAYDAVWALALALNSTLNIVQRGDLGRANCSGLPGQLVPLHEFSYSNALMGCLIQHNLANTEFLGVSGHVEFDVNGTRIQNKVGIVQYRVSTAGELEPVQVSSINVTDTTALAFDYEEGENDGSVFPGGIPSDGTQIKGISVFPLGFVIPYYLLATMGIAFTIVCLLFIVIFRRRRIVRLTSPNLNYFIVVGAILVYISIYFRLFPESIEIYQHIRCNLQNFLDAVGYVMCLGPVLAKMWRVYYIFHNPSPNKKAVKDWHLMVAVMGIVGVIALMAFLSVVVPTLRPHPALLPDEERPHGKTEDGITIVYCSWECYNKAPPFIWLALEFVYLAILQLAALGLAFKTRKVKIKVLNDSKSVAAIIYITSIIIAVVAVVVFALDSYIIAAEVFFSGGFIIGITVFLGFTFVTKMVSLYRDPEGKRVLNFNFADTTETDKLGATKHTNDSSETVLTLSIRIKELEAELGSYTSKAIHAETESSANSTSSAGSSFEVDASNPESLVPKVKSDVQSV